MLSANDYQKAMDSQMACNLMALVNSLAEVLPRIKEESDGVTDMINTHPIVRMYAEQIMFLSAQCDYSHAYNVCDEKSKGGISK